MQEKPIDPRILEAPQALQMRVIRLALDVRDGNATISDVEWELELDRLRMTTHLLDRVVKNMGWSSDLLETAEMTRPSRREIAAAVEQFNRLDYLTRRKFVPMLRTYPEQSEMFRSVCHLARQVLAGDQV